MIDFYRDDIRLFEYKDSYYYYDIVVKKILLIKNGYNKYIVRYYDVNKMAFVPLQLKIKLFFWGGGGAGGELHTFTNNDRLIPIHSDDKELFKKVEKHRIRLLN